MSVVVVLVTQRRNAGSLVVNGSPVCLEPFIISDTVDWRCPRSVAKVSLRSEDVFKIRFELIGWNHLYRTNVCGFQDAR